MSPCAAKLPPLMFLVSALSFGATTRAEEAAVKPEHAAFQHAPAAIRAHMRFLANDLLEGRAAGTKGEALAAAYIAAQFEAFGLMPGGAHGTYFQPVPLAQARATDPGSFTLKTKSAEQRLLFGEDYVPLAGFRADEQRISAPVAFVGFGIVAPERRLDSYAGLDVRGKIVLALSGAPATLPSEERAYYTSTVLKRQEAAKRGAAALIIVYTPTQQRVRTFDHVVKQWDQPHATWTDSSGIPFSTGVPELAIVSLSGGRKLFAHAPVSFDDVMHAAEHGDGTMRGFLLPITTTIETRSTISSARSSNVIGIVPGADPQLQSQYVVLTAHYDHLGMRAAGDGDAIYNGALDNAAGVAVLLETARSLAQLEHRPRRSVLFAIVTAEEQGIVGSDYFARHPTVPRESIVADVNVDMPLLAYDFQDVIAFGAAHSSLGPIVTQAAARMGIVSSPDPVPEQAVFIRSDSFRFVQQGIPSVMLATGFAGPGRAAYEEFLRHRYHQPGDDLDQPLDYAAGAKFTALVHTITIAIADQQQPPRWNAGDFFGTRSPRL